MQYNPANPLIVQGDRTVLLEVDNPLHAEARDAIAPFAELEKSPEHIHTYRLTPLSLWNAAAAGMTAEAMVDGAGDLQQVPAPAQPAGRPPRTGQPLRPGHASSGSTATLRLVTDGPAPARGAGPAEGGARLPGRADRRDQLRDRRRLPRRAQAGPDRASATRPRTSPATPTGADLDGRASARSPRSGLPFRVRDYQRMAVDAFHAGGDVRGGSGVIVLPCGAGKTIVGIAALAALEEEHPRPDHQHHGRRAVAARDPRQDRPRRRRRSPPTPATRRRSRRSPLATYQIVTYRPKKDGDFPHFELFNERDWGLIIYDEVHLLPAPVFRVTADIQARRRLGPDGHAGPRGRPRGGRLQPDRPQEVRRPLAGAGDRRAGSPRPSATRSASACPATRGWSTPWPSGATSSAWPARTRSRTTWSSCCWTSTTAPTTAC